MLSEIRKNDELLSKIVIIIFRFGNNVYHKIHIPVIRQILYFLYKIIDFLIIRLVIGSEIPATIVAGKGMILYHPYGIIINPGVKIGENVVIRHQVTIGNNGIDFENPIIEDNVNIGAGAKIIGEITILSNSIIGANAVVNKNFKKAGLLVGVPAVLRKESE